MAIFSRGVLVQSSNIPANRMCLFSFSSAKNALGRLHDGRHFKDADEETCDDGLGIKSSHMRFLLLLYPTKLWLSAFPRIHGLEGHVAVFFRCRKCEVLHVCARGQGLHGIETEIVAFDVPFQKSQMVLVHEELLPFRMHVLVGKNHLIGSCVSLNFAKKTMAEIECSGNSQNSYLPL